MDFSRSCITINSALSQAGGARRALVRGGCAVLGPHPCVLASFEARCRQLRRWLGHEAVPHVRDGFDEPRVCRILLDLPAQKPDVDVQIALVADKVGAPHAGVDVGSLDHLSRVRDQQLQERERTPRKLDLTAADVDAVRRDVDQDVACGKPLSRWCGAGPSAASPQATS
jgi:hypothetical protein